MGRVRGRESYRGDGKRFSFNVPGSGLRVPGFSVGVWECGSVEVWECGNVEVWKYGMK